MTTRSHPPARLALAGTDGPLVRSSGERQSAPRRRWLLPLLAVVVLTAAVLAWRTFLAPTPSGTATATGPLALVGPTDAPDQADAPRLRLQLSPAQPGANTAAFQFIDIDGTPVPDLGPPLQIGIASLDDPAAEQTVEARPDGGGAAVADLALDRAGWWRVRVPARPDAGLADEVVLYLLLPDPNRNGNDAVDTPESSPEAAAVYERGRAATNALRRVRFRQTIADGVGHVANTEQAVNDGSDGQTPAYAYRAQAGLEAYIIGGYRWMRKPGEAWDVNGSLPPIPPAAWAEEYEGATGFRLGGTETVDGERCQIVTFVVPERTEPYRQSAAWYAWWVGEESGQVRRATMVSRSHYMVTDYFAFDAPLSIASPVPVPAPVPIASPEAGA